MFLRARYYDPAVGRFVSKDIWPAHAALPSILHRYVYAANNPMNVLDPTGYFNVRQIGQGLLDIGAGFGNVGKSVVLGGIATGLCATTIGIGCVGGGIVAVYAANEAFVGRQKIATGVVEIFSSDAPVEQPPIYDPIEMSLANVTERAFQWAGLNPSEGQQVGRSAKFLLDVTVSLSIGSIPQSKADSIAYNLWQGGIISNLGTSRIIGDVLASPVLSAVSNLSTLQRGWKLWQSGVQPVFAPTILDHSFSQPSSRSK